MHDDGPATTDDRSDTPHRQATDENSASPVVGGPSSVDASRITHHASLTEASLAPREGELLSLPFDQYGRMRIAQNVMTALYGDISEQLVQSDAQQFTLQVLDVGGYPGVLPHFLEGGAYAVTVLDVVPDDGTIPGYRQGSGLDLPYEDASFDVVTSLDTLEHIPAEHRDRFLAEIKRVARYAALLINPIQSVEADLAEETLDEYIRWILDAQQEQLAEHRQYGLPDFAATGEAFARDGWNVMRFATANIHNWLFMMVAKHYLISLRDERASAFERTLDRFYNLTFTESDREGPGYRGVLVAVRPGFEGALRRVEELYPPVEAGEGSNTERLQLAQLLMSLIDLKIANHEDRGLREQIWARDKHISGMETRLALQDVEADKLRSQVNTLQEQIRTQAREAEKQLRTQAREADKQLRSQARTMEVQHQTQTRALEEQINDLRQTYDAEFAKDKRYIAQLEEEVRSKNEHILYLEKLLQGIESGRVMRTTRALARFLGRE